MVSSFVAYIMQHVPHPYGLSCGSTHGSRFFKCFFFKFSFVVNNLLHLLPSNDFSPSWIFMSIFKSFSFHTDPCMHVSTFAMCDVECASPNCLFFWIVCCIPGKQIVFLQNGATHDNVLYTYHWIFVYIYCNGMVFLQYVILYDISIVT